MDNNTQITLNSTTNSLDPTVLFDPTFSKSTITKNWNPNDKTEPGATDTSMYSTIEDATRVDGINHPIIQLNNTTIQSADIIEFKLSTTGFVPELDLQIRKQNYFVGNIPGLVNKVTVILIPPVDGTYKKISVDFYINSMDMIDDIVIFDCSFFYPPFENRYTKSINNGSSNKLTTYELFENIAKETNLGFAITPQCKEVQDKRPRLCFNQSYIDVLKQHLKFGGIDDKSFFTAWVDVYGYLILCNLSWVLSQAVSFNDLSIKQLEGLNITNTEAFSKNNIKFGDDTFRTLTNVEVKTKEEANIIRTYKIEIDNSSIKTHGTNNTYYIVNHKTNDGTNGITTENIKIEDTTSDGKLFKEAYNFEKNKFLGVELGLTADGNSPVLLQEQRREAYNIKLNSKKLIISMKQPHLGLQRGTLVNIVLYEYDSQAKSTIIHNMENITDSQNLNIEPYEVDSETTENIITNPTVGLPNISISGMYYIDGIEYAYSNAFAGIQQTLYLIRKSPEASYYSFSTVNKDIPGGKPKLK